jgi:hypothetical protein
VIAESIRFYAELFCVGYPGFDTFVDEGNQLFQIFAGIDFLGGHENLKVAAIFGEDCGQGLIAIRILFLKFAAVEEGLVGFHSCQVIAPILEHSGHAVGETAQTAFVSRRRHDLVDRVGDGVEEAVVGVVYEN